jgi:hypothetical protein
MANIVQTVFTYTGANQSYTVAPGVTSITVKMWGAGGGGNGTGRGGGGAYVEGTLAVTPGETLTVIVGSGGSRYDTANNYGGGGGSATVRAGGGQGGGRSALRRGATEVVTAGGGGGGSSDGGWWGGAATVDSQSFAGDVTAGVLQVQTTALQSSGSGGGGSTTAGGVNGAWPNPRGSAGQFQGGTGSGDATGGGGGGGFYGGGGGGYAGGGGGGSSLLTNLTSTSNSQSAARDVPGNNGSSLRGTAGTGGINVAGGNGLVALESPFTQSIEQIRPSNTSPIPASQQGTPVIYNYTGAYQNYVVPAAVRNVLVFLWGAGGGIGLVNGGGGAYVTGMLPVTPGETLRLIVGAGGHRNVSSDATGGNGIGFYYGGGRSAIQRSNTDIVVAGAGGGGSLGDNGGCGGNGTWSGIAFTGSSGSLVQFRQTALNGQNGGGGSQSAGGAGYGTPGSSKGQGGSSTNYAGGGGGGWYGGGGGAQSPPNHGTGGAGSSYIDLLLAASGADAVLGQTGFKELYWTNPIGCGNGDGRIVIVPIIPSTVPVQLAFSNIAVITQRVNFFGTGTIQTWIVPPGVFSLRFFLWGAGGVGQNGNINSTVAASAAYVEGNLITSPGTTYSIIVGRPGQTGLANGGGTTGGTSAGGGGFSGIFSGSPAANTVIAIAGGGGGSGFNGGGNGGAGGYPNGFAGVGTQSQGGGGTQSAGGSSSVTPGSQLAGGNGGAGDGGGGGGGGGWYGGGGGTGQGAGGGGSSRYISSVLNPVTVNGRNGGGAISPTPAANLNSPYWISPFGSGGQNGLVVIGYNQQPISVTVFTYTGNYITYSVPSGITSYYAYMWGAGGSGNNQGVNGGAGAFLSGTFTVTPGETLRLIVGKGGVAAGQNATDAQGRGGSSLGTANSAQGGGRSAIQRDIAGTYTEIITVGGGGGAGYYGYTGGAGSYTTQGRRGGDQVYSTAFNSLRAGGGGSNTGGQGAYGKTASDGAQFRGGDVILSYGNPNGGGGGGGWYGGGGGSGGTPGEGGPGGGGSSYITNLTGVSGQDSDGQPAPGTSSPFYPGGTVAAGGISNTQAGGNGYIALVPLLPSRISPFRFQPTRISAVGGEIFTTSQYRYHLYRNSGIFGVSNTVPGMTIFYMIVGGGGGGGDRHGAGGGAGGLVSGSFLPQPNTPQLFTVTVGEGGLYGAVAEGGQSATGDPAGSGTKGGDSSITGIGIAYGGGGGGTLAGNPINVSGPVGSGGGGGGNGHGGIAATAGQGFAGGNGGNPAGGGGGGAGGAGANANTSTGGVGTASFSQHLLAVGYGSTFATSPNSPISGGVAYIAGGGGGGANSDVLPSVRAGGLGGGGNGDWNDTFITAGTPNTGGGGGASRSGVVGSVGRNGGSGLVLIWYSK